MIDISEPMFDMMADPDIPPGYCIMLKGRNVIYVGPIRHSPDVADGTEMILNPVDYDKLNDWFKKHQH